VLLARPVRLAQPVPPVRPIAESGALHSAGLT
jgi:hypothetical protein